MCDENFSNKQLTKISLENLTTLKSECNIFNLLLFSFKVLKIPIPCEYSTVFRQSHTISHSQPPCTFIFILIFFLMYFLLKLKKYTWDHKKKLIFYAISSLEFEFIIYSYLKNKLFTYNFIFIQIKWINYSTNIYLKNYYTWKYKGARHSEECKLY